MTLHAERRDQLIDLVCEIIDCRDRGESDSDALSAFEEMLPGTDVNDLCDSYFPAEVIVDICLGRSAKTTTVSEHDLVDIVESLMQKNLPEAEQLIAIETFVSHSKHPAQSDLIFCPEEYFDGNERPSAEEIVAKALGKTAYNHS